MQAGPLFFFFQNILYEVFKLIIYFFFTLESPTSEIEFAMDKLGGNPKRNNDVEMGNQPKKSKRRNLTHHLFDLLAIAIST